MMRAILVEYEVFKDGEIVDTGITTLFSNYGYNKLLRKLLKGLREQYKVSSVYAKRIVKL